MINGDAYGGNVDVAPIFTLTNAHIWLQMMETSLKAQNFDWWRMVIDKNRLINDITECKENEDAKDWILSGLPKDLRTQAFKHVNELWEFLVSMLGDYCSSQCDDDLSCYKDNNVGCLVNEDSIEVQSPSSSTLVDNEVSCIDIEFEDMCEFSDSYDSLCDMTKSIMIKNKELAHMCKMENKKIAMLVLENAYLSEISMYVISCKNDTFENEKLCNAFDDPKSKYANLLRENSSLKHENESMLNTISLLEKEVALVKETHKKANIVDLEKIELRQHLVKSKKENDTLKDVLEKVELGERNFMKMLNTQCANSDRSGVEFKNKKSIASTSTWVKAKEKVSMSTKQPSHVHNSSHTKFTCTYCNHGNHLSSMCPIRKLCEMGTLVPPSKKPKWVVKTSPQNANPHGPKKIWVPKSSFD